MYNYFFVPVIKSNIGYRKSVYYYQHKFVFFVLV